MGNQKGSVVVAVVVVLVILYGVLWAFSMRGWGYSGWHNGYHGSSFWYMGGPRNYYAGPSVRTGSVGGPGHIGGGPGAGK